MKKIYLEKCYEIRSSDFDCTGRVALTTLVGLITDAGWSHVQQWQAGFPQLQRNRLTWVNTSLRLQVDRHLLWVKESGGIEEQVQVRTWAAAREKFYWIRDFRLHDAAGQEFARASTSSILLNLETRRPCLKDNVVPYDISLSSGLPRVFSSSNHRLPGVCHPEDSALEFTFPTPLSALDANRHVGNAQYVRWLLDCYELEFCEQHEVAEIELQYLKEVLCGQKVAVRQSSSSSLRHEFRLALGSAEGPESLRASLLWRRIPDPG